MKKTRFAIALLASLLTLTACGGTAETPAASGTAASDSHPETSAAAETAAETAGETTAASDAPTTEAAPETTAAVPDGASNADFVSIAGDWFIDGDPSLACIHIEPDGAFQTYYATGAPEHAGIIRYETDEVGGTELHWYNLYTDAGEYLMGFIDDGSSVKTDLYVGNGATPHYQKFTGEGGLADDGRGPGEEFVGTWGCGRATLRITQLTDTEFRAEIHWAGSALAYAEWVYPLVYTDGKLVCDGKCTKTVIEYSSPDAEPDKTVEYTDGSGEFIMQDGGIIWNDLTEQSGEGMVFLNTPPEE